MFTQRKHLSVGPSKDCCCCLSHIGAFKFFFKRSHTYTYKKFFGAANKGRNDGEREGSEKVTLFLVFTFRPFVGPTPPEELRCFNILFCLRFDCGLMPKIFSNVVAVAKNVSEARDFVATTRDSITKLCGLLCTVSTPVMISQKMSQIALTLLLPYKFTLSLFIYFFLNFIIINFSLTEFFLDSIVTISNIETLEF